MTTEAAPVIAEGLIWDDATRAVTKRVTYAARDRMEAIRWINCHKDWMQEPRINGVRV